MKLEKREITLNEYDSLKDAFFLQKTLLHEYVCFLPQAERKETRNEMIRLVKEVIEDMYTIRDLMKSSESETGVGE